MRWERHAGARWDRDFDANLSLNFFYQGDREPWEVFEQGSLMFRSACYKDLSGVGVRMDWRGEVGGWSPERSPKEVRNRGQGSEFCIESSLLLCLHSRHCPQG